MTIFNIPRHERTPETEVDVLLANLSALYSELHPDAPQHHFINTYFKNMYFDKTCSGDAMAKILSSTCDKTNLVSKQTVGAIFLISCAYCVDATRAYNSGLLNDAWTFVIDARTWCSKLLSKSMRFMQFIEAEKANHNLSMKKVAERKKHVIYYSEQERFVDEMYLSIGVKIKTKAAKQIAPMLIDFILKKELQEEATPSGERKDWEEWTLRYLRKKY
jgi:hypothetical protein